MKKFLFAIAIASIITQSGAQSAQTFGDSIEGQTFNLAYDFPTANPTRFYRDGVQLKDFSISELTVSTNGTVVSFKVTIPGQSKGVFNFTCTILATAANGTLIESLPSNVCTVTVRPNAPGQLRKI